MKISPLIKQKAMALADRIQNDHNGGLNLGHPENTKKLRQRLDVTRSEFDRIITFLCEAGRVTVENRGGWVWLETV